MGNFRVGRAWLRSTAALSPRIEDDITFEMPAQEQTRFEYDLPTAVTFLVVGLAVGAILAVLFSPLTDSSTTRLQTSPPDPRVGASRR